MVFDMFEFVFSSIIGYQSSVTGFQLSVELAIVSIRNTLPPDLNTFPLTDSDKIWYVDLFWDNICYVYIFSLMFHPPEFSSPPP